MARFGPARALSCVCLALGLLSACASSTPPAESAQEYTENARIAYEEALVEYFDRDWELAIPMFEEVRRRYAYSRYARLSALRIGDAEFERGNHAESAAAYRAFIHDFPNDIEVPYARYRTAKALFEDSGENLLMPPLEERDLATIQDAYRVIRGILADYPGYKRRPELLYMLEVVAGHLARHELYVARFYLREQKFEAAAARIEYSMQHFQSSGLEPEALVLLGETLLMMKKEPQAREAFERVLAEFPASAFTVPARKFLNLIGPRGSGGPTAQLSSPLPIN